MALMLLWTTLLRQIDSHSVSDIKSGQGCAQYRDLNILRLALKTLKALFWVICIIDGIGSKRACSFIPPEHLFKSGDFMQEA